MYIYIFFLIFLFIKNQYRNIQIIAATKSTATPINIKTSTTAPNKTPSLIKNPITSILLKILIPMV